MTFHRSDSHLPQVEMNSKEMAWRFCAGRFACYWGDWPLRRCITTFAAIDPPHGLGLSWDPGEMADLFFERVEEEAIRIFDEEEKRNG